MLAAGLEGVTLYPNQACASLYGPRKLFSARGLRKKEQCGSSGGLFRHLPQGVAPQEPLLRAEHSSCLELFLMGTWGAGLHSCRSKLFPNCF